ncbi:winged helix-turn-helix domain-containing protein [Herbaspirillum lusitanum]|uniref:winged helix-turn-helix domain-containing protein n=1 Tax=Herbaspirillum lusitanum TaxID=213312 RepID=UPI0003158E39|nr:winged helix-turn-helix domain-containing protein [Herbaspirillum lusitanum]
MLDLSARELGLLEVLLQRTGRLVSKEQLVDHLCEWGEEVSNNAIEVYVHRLRKKIEVGGIRIATVRGLGYCLEKLPESIVNPTGGGPTVIRHGSLSYDQVGRIAYIGEQMLDLSARELGLLEVLLQRTGRLVSKEQLVDHLCEWGEEVSNNAIEVYVHRLRKKIEVGGIRIATVRGLGYCLEKLPESIASAGVASNA